MDELQELDVLVEIEKYEYLFLGRLAIEKGYILYQQLLEALLIQHEIPEGKLGYILFSLEYITQEQLQELLDEQKVFVESHPLDWSYIPDVVLKGLVYFGKNPLGNISGKEIRKAQQIRSQMKKQGIVKNLSDILVEDLAVITKDEIKDFQSKIQYKEQKCSQCSRVFQLFHHDPRERLRCPVCWTNYLKTIGLSSEKVTKKIVQESPPPKARRRDPVASTQMFKFYEELEKENAKEAQSAIVKKESTLEGKKASEPDTKKKEKAQVVERKVAPKIEKDAPPQPELKKIQEVRIHAQEQLKKIYEQLEKQEEETPKKKIVRGDHLNTPRGEKEMKLWQIYKKVGLAFSFVFVVFAIFFVYGFVGKMPLEKPYTPVPVAQDAVRTSSEALPAKTLQSLDNPFVRDILFAFAQGSAEPSHSHFNAILKKIHIDGQEHLRALGAGDLWNLMGRLYYYKIYIDREEALFENSVKKAWQEEAREAFQKAKALYSKEESIPLLILPIVSWMPEHLFHQGQAFVRYENPEEAIKDMEQWLKRMNL